MGLRSPHRMTYDAVDDITWIGDVGQSAREELDVLVKGANYQWDVFEGRYRSRGLMSDEPLGIWTDPVIDFGREDARSIIGGYVYRGNDFPELQGKYVYGDWEVGTVWALEYEWNGS